MSTLNLIVDATNLNSTNFLMQLKNKLPHNKITICKNDEELYLTISNIIEHNAKQKLVIIGTQQSFFLTFCLAKEDNFPFAFININDSIEKIYSEIELINNSIKPVNKTFIYYNEEISDTKGICKEISLGTKAQNIKLKNSFQNISFKNLNKSLKLPFTFHEIVLEIYNKGQFTTYYNISSADIKILNEQLLINLNKSLFFNLHLLFSPKKKHITLNENKLRLITTTKTLICYDKSFNKSQPIDLNLELISIYSW